MMTRQKIRRTLILVSLLVFPITLNYFSPALILEGAAKGIINGSFMTFSLQFLSSLFLGRGFCGWLCPGAGLQESIFPIQNKRLKAGRKDWIKYFIWTPWIGGIAFLAWRSGGYSSVQPLLHTQGGMSVQDGMGYTIYFSILTLITLPALLGGRRGFCHYLCWMAPFMVIGSSIRNRGGWPALHLRPEPAKCKDCKTCGNNCPMSLDVSSMVQRGSMRNSECILCGTCVDGCPQGVIEYSFKAGDR